MYRRRKCASQISTWQEMVGGGYALGSHLFEEAEQSLQWGPWTTASAPGDL